MKKIKGEKIGFEKGEMRERRRIKRARIIVSKKIIKRKRK